jgi:hypothetical protein
MPRIMRAHHCPESGTSSLASGGRLPGQHILPNWWDMSQYTVLVADLSVTDPAPVDRMLRADELQIGRLALGVGLKGAPQCRLDL